MDLAHQGQIAGGHLDPGADAVPVAAGAAGADADPMIPAGAVVAQDGGFTA
jgi:hypothetical protein